MLDFDGRCNRPDVARNVATGASFGRSTAETVSRLRCQRAGPPAQHSGGAWTWERIFFGIMCTRVFCVPEFEVGGPTREMWTRMQCMRGIFLNH